MHGFGIEIVGVDEKLVEGGRVTIPYNKVTVLKPEVFANTLLEALCVQSQFAMGRVSSEMYVSKRGVSKASYKEVHGLLPVVDITAKCKAIASSKELTVRDVLNFTSDIVNEFRSFGVPKCEKVNCGLLPATPEIVANEIEGTLLRRSLEGNYFLLVGPAFELYNALDLEQDRTVRRISELLSLLFAKKCRRLFVRDKLIKLDFENAQNEKELAKIIDEIVSEVSGGNLFFPVIDSLSILKVEKGRVVESLRQSLLMSNLAQCLLVEKSENGKFIIHDTFMVADGYHCRVCNLNLSRGTTAFEMGCGDLEYKGERLNTLLSGNLRESLKRNVKSLEQAKLSAYAVVEDLHLSSKISQLSFEELLKLVLVRILEDELRDTLFIVRDGVDFIASKASLNIFYLLIQLALSGNTVIVLSNERDRFDENINYLDFNQGSNSDREKASAQFKKIPVSKELGVIDVVVNQKVFSIKQGVLTAISQSGGHSSSAVLKILSEAIANQKISKTSAAKTRTRQTEVKRVVPQIFYRSIFFEEPKHKTLGGLTCLSDEIAELFARLPKARQSQLTAADFNLENSSRMCPQCLGSGVAHRGQLSEILTEEVCELCGGKSFRTQSLQIKYNEIDIFQVYKLPFVKLLSLFSRQPKIVELLQQMLKIGLKDANLGESPSIMPHDQILLLEMLSFLSSQNYENKFLLLDHPFRREFAGVSVNIYKTVEDFVSKGGTAVIATTLPEIINCASNVIEY